MSATKQKFAEMLEVELRKYPWSQDADRMARAMEAVRKTLNGSRTCAFTESWLKVWKEIGLKGKPTYKALHQLPDS